jgi:hypothetical protein
MSGPRWERFASGAGIPQMQIGLLEKPGRARLQLKTRPPLMWC